MIPGDDANQSQLKKVNTRITYNAVTKINKRKPENTYECPARQKTTPQMDYKHPTDKHLY